jgi:multiple sugar transport system permease protein
MISSRMPPHFRKAMLLLLAILVLIPFLFPFFWMFMGSIKDQVDFLAYPPVWIFKPTLENYRNIFIFNDFGAYTFNSLIVATLTTLFGLLIGIPGAYAVARYRRTGFGIFVLAARMAPGIAFLLPWFIIFVKTNLTDTYFSLVMTHLIFTLPLILWMMIGFIEGVPLEIEQAAMVDGCTVWGSLFRVVIPLTLPGVAAAAILSFIFSWNNFLFSVVLAGDTTKTLPVAVFSFMGYQAINWGPLCAAASIITVPVLVMAMIVQKYIVRGLAAGGV